MSGLDNRRVVLIHSTVTGPEGVENHVYGTGYLITDRLVLTARHVLSTGSPEKLEVRVPEDSDPWKPAFTKPAWESVEGEDEEKVDAVLIQLTEPVKDVAPYDWELVNLEENKEWESLAYPEASSIKGEGARRYKTSGLQGKIYRFGGGGQGSPELELGVDYEAEWWNGISGAPVFVDNKLIGIIKTSSESFKQKRLAAAPISQLLADPSFRNVIAPKWLHPFPSQTWVLVLLSENSQSKLSGTVKAAIRERSDRIREQGHLILEHPVVVNVTDALQSPERLLGFVQAISAAPIMVVDVSEFQPAVMFFLGVRAVARRGVTIATINQAPDEASLSKLPFNIQETKLIHVSNQPIGSPEHPVNRIGSAILSGLMQLKSDPSYLDLPAYDAVRIPEPKSLDKTQLDRDKIQDKILMLCPFRDDYKQHWLYVSNEITREKAEVKASLGSLERMLDISSPRLVGQALYEGIRWTRCCVVDWTHWRANVFFELGVRYSCSDLGALCLIEENHGNTSNAFPLQQQKLLLDLLDPVVYTLNGSSDPFKEVFARYEAIIDRKAVTRELSVISHDAIYQTMVDSYFWRQESIMQLPHEELKMNIEAQLGPDRQKEGTVALNVLFSSNPEFSRELERSVRERWIAAWAYFRSRYSPEEFHADPVLLAQFGALSEHVAQELSTSSDCGHQRIRDEIIAVIDELETT